MSVSDWEGGGKVAHCEGGEKNFPFPVQFIPFKRKTWQGVILRLQSGIHLYELKS